MQKIFNLKQRLTQNCAKGNLKMFCHISFMLWCHNKKEEVPVSTAVLPFQRLNKNRQGIEGIDEGYTWNIFLTPAENNRSYWGFATGVGDFRATGNGQLANLLSVRRLGGTLAPFNPTTPLSSATLWEEITTLRWNEPLSEIQLPFSSQIPHITLLITEEGSVVLVSKDFSRKEVVLSICPLHFHQITSQDLLGNLNTMSMGQFKC